MLKRLMLKLIMKLMEKIELMDYVSQKKNVEIKGIGFINESKMLIFKMKD